MSDPVAEARRLAQTYVELLNERRLPELGAVLAPTLVSHLRVGDIVGVEAFRGVMQMAYEAFPGVVWVIDELIATPDRAVVRYHFDAVQRGPFLGIPASHRMVHLEGVELLHIADGKIHTIWNYADIMGLAAQLGAEAPLAVEI
ncbi:ester cyclase [Myxococcota bacterium]|nr:ester cyclase [Myxococcota bacterium]